MGEAYWWSVYVNFMDEISNTQFSENQTLSLSLSFLSLDDYLVA